MENGERSQLLESDKASGRRISVAMATYNGEKYLSEQLDSIVRQSVLPAEVVITDDGSSDGTIEIIQRFSASAPFPVKLFKNERRLGYADNFLKAASLCSEELIAFCDQDDRWLENKLSTCLAAFDDPSVLLCVHSAKLWHGGDKTSGHNPRFQKQKTYSPLSAYPIQTYPGFAMVVRRSLLEIADNATRPGLPGKQQQLAHDQWVWFLASIFGRIIVLPDVLALYRQHNSNVFGGTARSMNQTLSLAVQPRSYQDLSNTELHFAAYLRQASSQFAAPLRSSSDSAAALLSRRALLNAQRARLYDERAGLSQRVRAFVEILSHGGYLPGKEAARIGTRAAVKDFVFGVPGIHKRLWAAS